MNSWKIFSNDIKNVGTNWVAAIIIGGLIFLPSLYAWLNIIANWDPYGQTEQIPVGVVNEDTGEVIRDEEIDVGEELVDTLKDNDSMDWHFLKRDKAMKQLEKGDLYAVVIIPKNFSENLGTVVHANPEKADVEYYVNEKLNAIAPKITEKGASVIVDDISSNFISTVNGVIFDVFNEIGIELEKDLPDMKRFENYVFEMEKRLPEIHKTLKSTLSDADEAEGIVSKAQKAAPEADKIAGSGLETIDSTTEFLEKAENRLNEMGPNIKKDLEKAQETASKINSFFNDIDNVDIDLEQGKAIKEKIGEDVDQSIVYIEKVEDVLQEISAQMDNNEYEERLEETMTKLNDIKGLLVEGRENTEEIDRFIEDKQSEVDDVFTNIQELSSNVDTRLGEFISEYTDSIEPKVMGEIANAKGTLTDARGILGDVKSTIPEVEELLNRTSGSLGDGKGLINDVLNEYPYVNDKVNELADKIREVKDEADINEIIDLLQNDPEAERSFFSEPVTLEEHSVFPVETYGSGMTPFYTVLSLWVGGLLLISMLTTDTQEPELYKSGSIYFGKLFTFAFIGFLQTLIVTFGDLFLIQVNIANPVWFVIFGLFCSLVFITIIYTLVSIFGDVGKSMAIVMLVLQIAGSGGTYPVDLLPKFFQTISPFLPFTYAVDIMREAVGGIVWSNAIWDLSILAMFGLIAIVFGTIFKEPINKQSNKLVKKSRESGVFH